MATITVQVDGPIAVATMRSGENRIGRAMISAWHDLLDDIEADAAVSSMVVTGESRFWSNGLDLSELEAMDDTDRRSFMRSFDLLLGRVMTTGLVTVAALNGHTYAGGALLALAHDYRIMRRDRGYFCLPSVEIGIPFSPGMSALIAGKLPQPIAHDLVVSCRRIGGEEAERTGVVHGTAPEGEVLSAALDIAHAYAGRDRQTLRTVKRRMYPEATDMLTAD